ncbi:hypothetical protein CFC21_015964 [Triticum aestivum]|uniref:Bifunctional inhibitor/plant lipid transfer protein/seed storage helical domain-containing protein n=3 Tax=Triticum TaxID=4564 RepID=A0A9R1NMV7_TRITD|nr:non-specific lipid transfer protein-like 1 [Triticum dicoccoides]XP_044455817.1 non-specific lipid transfer protein-like 1 [Triticum aestivum]KAF7000005.1 hypothetical protein CFC21_015964 [Triticum aestivum]VAH27838.1 unnamed protein product [Triticum turgidum subsp. durum]
MARPAHAVVAAVLTVVLALASGAASQAPAAGPAGPAGDCGSALTGLAGCLPYISPGAAQGKPPKECCAGVKAALASPASVACLCDAFGKDYGIPMNLTRAKGLPAACGGNPAALSNCSLKLPGGAPNGAPTEAPTPTSGSTPATISPSPAKSAATRSPVSAATLLLAAVLAPLLSYYYL